MTREIYLRESLDIFDKIDAEYCSPAGIMPDAGVALSDWISQSIYEGNIAINAPTVGVINLDYDNASGEVSNTNGTGFIIPIASETTRGLMSVDDKSNINNLITLSGMPEDSPNLGSFTGTIIPTNVSVRDALQNLETAIETSGYSQAKIQIKDHGFNLGAPGAMTTLNIAGTGLTASLVGGTLTISSANINIDNIPMIGSANTVSSGGVYDALLTKVNTSAYTKKGVILVGTGVNQFTQFESGDNDKVMTSDSSASTGLKWDYVKAMNVLFQSTSTLTSTNVQSVINELDVKKQKNITYQKNSVTLNNQPINTINFTGNATTTTVTGSTLTVFTNLNGTNTWQYVTLNPTGINTIPNLTPLPLNYSDVIISINGVDSAGSISVNSNGVFSINTSNLGYDIDTDDIITAEYFSI
jgi:hypothetical protein